MGSERRRSPRIEMLGRVHGHVTSLDVAVTVREMSLGGMSLETEFAFPEGTVHAFVLTLGDGSAVDLRGRVVRCMEAPRGDGTRRYITGIQFVDEEPTDVIDKMK
jgi:hypothetical protein